MPPLEAQTLTKKIVMIHWDLHRRQEDYNQICVLEIAALAEKTHTWCLHQQEAVIKLCPEEVQ